MRSHYEVDPPNPLAITKQIDPTCEIETPRAILTGLQWLVQEKARIEKATSRTVKLRRKRRQTRPKLVMWIEYASTEESS